MLNFFNVLLKIMTTVKMLPNKNVYSFIGLRCYSGPQDSAGVSLNNYLIHSFIHPSIHSLI